MDAQLDPSEILNLFTGEDIHTIMYSSFDQSILFSSPCADLADKKQLDCRRTLSVAHSTIQRLQSDLGTESVDGSKPPTSIS